MSRYYEDSWYIDKEDITEDDIIDTRENITALCRDYNGRYTYVTAVNRVFYDLFSVKEMGTIFAKDTRYSRYASAAFKKCGSVRLINMMLDEDTYRDIQALVKLYYEINHAKDKKNVEDAITVYFDAIDNLKRQYGIRVRSSVSSIQNPMKYLRKRNRDFDDEAGFYDDGYGYSRIYDDYDDDYDDRGGRRRRRRRRDDDDFDDDAFVDSILEGVDPDVIKRKGNSRRKNSKRSDSRRSRGSDDDDYESDFEDSVINSLSTVTDAMNEFHDRISNLERLERDSIYEDAPRNNRARITDNGTSDSSIDALTRSIKSVAKNQREQQKTIEVLSDAVLAMMGEDDTEEAEDSPGDNEKGSGDLMTTTGGIITDPEVLR